MTKDLVSEDGENMAVRAFMMLYGSNTVDVSVMKRHMQRCGFPLWPKWAEDYNSHLTKSGAQDWIRYLFSLEITEKVSSDGSTLVNCAATYNRINRENPPPKGVKMLLIDEKRGTATLSTYTENCDFTHYAGLPKFK